MGSGCALAGTTPSLCLEEDLGKPEVHTTGSIDRIDLEATAFCLRHRRWGCDLIDLDSRSDR